MARTRRPFFEERRSQGEIVFGYLKKRSQTCGEIVALTGFKHQSASARLNDLEKAGCICRSGSKREGSDIYEIVADRTYDDFRKWQKGAGSRELSPRTKFIKLCESDSPSKKSWVDLAALRNI